MFSKEVYKQKLEQIRSAKDDVERMQVLLELEQDYHTTLAEHEELTTNLQKANEDVTRYAKLNNELWLGNKVKDSIESTEETLDETIEPPKKRTFEELENKFY